MEENFAHPPDAFRPWVNWFWMDGNITREGITADLESMKRVGLGGALLMDVSQEIPPGPVRFASPQWEEMFQHTLTEAKRLGLEIRLHNAPGWSGSGGPWITPALAMQQLVWNKTNFSGPTHYEGPLPELRKVNDYNRDIATLAFPVLLGEGAPIPGFSPRIHFGSEKNLNGGALIDGKTETSVRLPTPTRSRPQTIELQFSEPFTANRLRMLSPPGGLKRVEGTIEMSQDGKSYIKLRDFLVSKPDLSLTFDLVAAKYFRIFFTSADPSLRQIEISEIELIPSYGLESYQAKTGMNRSPIPPLKWTNVPPSAVVHRDQIIDLSKKVDPTGRLVWDVPAGNWTVVRLGYTPMGTENHPVAAEGLGLECDKLSKEAIETHFNAFLGKLIAQNGSSAGSAFSGTHIDSWEIGFQNWTPAFPEEFKKRRGYDLTKFLPAYTGRIVGSPEISERFFWDVRRTIADLEADNYAGHLAELAHQHGLKLSIEAYSNGPFDNLVYAGRADIPMAEFWTEHDDFSRFSFCRSMSSAAHVYGKPIVDVEAFTSFPGDASWQNHPFSLKPLADAAMCRGVNRFVIHCFAHQPWLDQKPGMTMGPFGVNYNRNETWWEYSLPWHQYLARCQYLLQSGLFAPDICYITPEGAYAVPPPTEKLDPPLPAGYDYDLAPPEILMSRMSVKDGRITLPNGLGYQILVLPIVDAMTPEFLAKVKELVTAGATVVAGSRPAKSPSLANFPQCDAMVGKLADELWGDCDGKTKKEHRLGKGKLVCGESLSKVLAQVGNPPDFNQLGPISGYALTWLHRKTQGADIYFVANSNEEPVDAECEFRIKAKQPELWHPETGLTEKSAIWKAEGETTRLHLGLDGSGSVFVVFRDPVGISNTVESFTRNGVLIADAALARGPAGSYEFSASEGGTYEVKTRAGVQLKTTVANLPSPIDLGGDWDVRFPSDSQVSEQVHFKNLQSWTTHSNPRIKYFAGAASYHKNFLLPANFFGPQRELLLDLGRVQVMATVALNGKALGTLWKPPFLMDISSAAKPGENQLQIKVINLWPNRLIGDEQLPDDCRWQRGKAAAGSSLVEWPQWLLDHRARPSGRVGFATWKYWTKTSPLIESGLLGPVTVQVKQKVVLAGAKSNVIPSEASH